MSNPGDLLEPIEKASYRTLKLPDPAHLIKRLDIGHEAGILSNESRAELVGQSFLLVDGSKAWGVAKIMQGRAIPSGPKAAETLGAKIDKTTAEDFRAVSEQVWYHPLQIVERWDPPRAMATPAPVVKQLSAAQEAELKIEDAKIAANKQKPMAKQPHKFIAAKYTHPNGHPRCVICGDEESISGFCNSPDKDKAANEPVVLGKCRYCDADADSVLGVKGGGAAVPVCKAHTPEGLKPRSGMVIQEVDKAEQVDPDELRSLSTKNLLDLLLVFEHDFERRDNDESKLVDIVAAVGFILEELIRRDEPAPPGKLVSEARRLRKAYAHGAESGESPNKTIKLDALLAAVGKDAVISRAAVSVVGGIANHGETPNNVDIVIKGDLDNATRKVVESKIGRMLASKDPDMANRVQFLDEDMGGTGDDHVELFDLMMVARQRPQIAQTAHIEKADDPLMDIVDKPGPRSAVLQAHGRGRSLHLDLRLKMDGHLTGWTLTAQRAGAVPDLNTVEDVRRITQGFTPEGNDALKPLQAPAKVLAIPKASHPLEWLDIDAKVIEPGDVGATTEGVGVIVALDRPKWEQGSTKPDHHEYFFTDGKILNGVVHARKLVGHISPRGDGQGPKQDGGGPNRDGMGPRQDGGGQRTPEGETYWNLWLSKDALPSILSTRAVRNGDMPPDGRSWIPQSLEQVTPKEFRYWERKGAEAKLVRDALVKARYFTDENVKIVSGQFRRTVQKMYLCMEAEKVEKRGGMSRPQTCKYKGCNEEAIVGLIWADGRAYVPSCKQHQAYYERTLSDVVARRPLPTKEQRCGYGGCEAKAVYTIVARQAKQSFVCSAHLDSMKQQTKDVVAVRRIHKAVKKAADVRPFVLARQVREGKTQWHLMFHAPGSEMHVLRMDANPMNEDASIDGEHTLLRSREMMEKGTADDWTIVDRGSVAVLDEEPNKWRLSFKGKDLRGVYEVAAKEPGGKQWTLKRSTARMRAFASARVNKGSDAKVLCFYHRDLDGVASAAIVAGVHKGAELRSINYGEDFPWNAIEDREIVYMVDFGMQPFEDMVKLKAKLDKQGTTFIWIDHHKTAMEEAEKVGFECEGLRKNGEAGCELTWAYLHPDDPLPEVVRRAGRFDVWDHSDPNTMLIHYAMEANEEANDPSSSWWPTWLKKGKDAFGEMITEGTAISKWLTSFNAGQMNSAAFEAEFHGLKCVAACTTMHGSMQFDSVQRGYDAAIAFHMVPGGEWTVSMYGLKPSADCGAVCAKYGGGGHKGAAGFQCKKLPFDLPNNKAAKQEGVAKQEDGEFRERLAAVQHGIWSHWMRYQLSVCHTATADSGDPGMLIPRGKADRWKRQMETPYADLSEKEKDSDREQADKVLAVRASRVAKAARTLRALVITKTPEDPGSTQAKSFVYECAIGPLREDEIADWGMIVEHDGEKYTKVGKTTATNVDAEAGDTLEVEVEGLLLDSKPPKTITWFKPSVIDKTTDSPLTTHSASSMVRDDEIKKLDGRAYQPLPLIKSDSLRYVLGIVLEPNDGQDGAPLDPDSQRDVYSAEEIRQAQWNFWQFLQIGEVHRRQVHKAKIEIVDCFIAPTDFVVGGQRIRKGTWMLGAHILDTNLWKKIENGEYNAWSVDGSAVRIPEKRQVA